MSSIYKVGRPTNLTPELIDHLVKLVPTAFTQHQLGRLSGVPQRCISDWLSWGKADREKGEDTIYAQFSLKYEEAKGILLREWLLKMMALGSFQANQWMLEQCFPDEFGLNSPLVKDLLGAVDAMNLKKVTHGGEKI
jgi:hypothetical protein